ncbi:MAG: prepilin-type N-terminal cleavage/methylation domain-containing protein [Acidobacteriota bacterium]
MTKLVRDLLKRQAMRGTSMNRPREESPKASRAKSGFTLLEVLVTLALISIIAAISFYSYSSFRPRLQLTNTAREVMAFIHRARLVAIRTHNTVTISVENELGTDSDVHNPTGIKAERLVLTRVDAFGNVEEISSYQLPKSFPPIFVWGDEEATVQGDSSITFGDDVLTINSDGTVTDIGAFRFSYAKSVGNRNILEVSILSQAGSPQIRKWLAPEDRPSSLAAQEYFTETTAAGSTRNLWIWY